jgi:hypothetical protein
LFVVQAITAVHDKAFVTFSPTFRLLQNAQANWTEQVRQKHANKSCIDSEATEPALQKGIKPCQDLLRTCSFDVSTTPSVNVSPVLFYHSRWPICKALGTNPPSFHTRRKRKQQSKKRIVNFTCPWLGKSAFSSSRPSFPQSAGFRPHIILFTLFPQYLLDASDNVWF